MKELIAEYQTKPSYHVTVRDGKIIAETDELTAAKGDMRVPVYHVKRFEGGQELRCKPQDEWVVKEGRVEMTHETKPLTREVR